jgi:hypothetical protein
LSLGKLKIKLYRDKEGNLKGDGRCCYLKARISLFKQNIFSSLYCNTINFTLLQIENVDLALKILDDSNFKGKQIKVEKVI